ncbi:MAG: DUF3656 domain-containing protein, partial [Proteobacteria bacterium]|nr:DUF3656 domain-containing protein [Pseudomonadota bacterium]
AQYYRALLDGSSDAEYLGEELAIAYGRRQTGGWLTGYGRAKQDFTVRSKPTLGSVSFPQHRGLVAATVLSQTEEGVWVRTHRPLSLRDGLMYLLPGSKEPIKAVRFGLFSLINEWDEPTSHIEGNRVAHIALSESDSWPKAGEHLYQVSAHDQNPQEYSEAINPWARPIDLTITLNKEAIAVEGWSVQRKYEIAFDTARSVQQTFENFSDVFSRSDTAPFTLGTLTLINNTGLAEEDLFYPLSHLNEIRRDFYEHLQEAFDNYLRQPWPDTTPPTSERWVSLPNRSSLIDEDGLPWISPQVFNAETRKGHNADDLLFAADGLFYFPLPPAMFEQKRFLEDLARSVDHLEQQGMLDRVRFGLNNIGQLLFFRERGLSTYADIYLYLSNSESAKLLLASDLHLIGGYLWLERSNTDMRRWPVQPTIVDRDFTAPAFISRSCFRHDSLHLSCKGCPHHGSWIVRGDTMDYRVIVQDCITMAIAIR